MTVANVCGALLLGLVLQLLQKGAVVTAVQLALLCYQPSYSSTIAGASNFGTSTHWFVWTRHHESCVASLHGHKSGNCYMDVAPWEGFCFEGGVAGRECNRESGTGLGLLAAQSTARLHASTASIVM